jgi:serine/threonine protein kinase
MCSACALQALAAIHSRGFMHKDVKTDNFCMNQEPHRTTSIYAIDYGFSRPAFGERQSFLRASTWCPNAATLTLLVYAALCKATC